MSAFKQVGLLSCTYVVPPSSAGIEMNTELHLQ